MSEEYDFTPHLIEKYGIKNGDVYEAASGNGSRVIVTDVETFAFCDDVVIAQCKDGAAVSGTEYRMDAFKLHMVRYSKVTT